MRKDTTVSTCDTCPASTAGLSYCYADGWVHITVPVGQKDIDLCPECWAKLCEFPAFKAAHLPAKARR